MSLPQENFLATLSRQSDTVGQLFWFTMQAEPVSQDQWVQAITTAGLATYGLPGDIPPATAYLRGLHAMRLQTRQHGIRTLLRVVERPKGRVIHHWIRETVSGEQVTFTPLAAITREYRHDTVSSTALTPLDPEERTALAALPHLIDTALHTYTAGDRRRQIRRWFATLQSLAMDHAGPVQFVPQDGAGIVQVLTEHQETLGIQCWALPLARNPQVLETLAQNVEAQVQHDAVALLNHLKKAHQAGKTPTTAQQKKMLADFHALEARAQHYAEVLDTQSSALSSHLDVVRQQIRAAFIE